MSNENADKPGTGGAGESERPRYVYFVDGTKYEFEASSITGAQIKAKVSNYNPTFQLFLEGKGGQPDRVIGDSDSVDLAHGAAHLYTAPPATFGSASDSIRAG
jgi:hypothetical protein